MIAPVNDRMNGLALIPPDRIPPELSSSVRKHQQLNDPHKQIATIETGLSAHIQKCWQRNRDHKQIRIEKEMVEDLRAKKGEYSARELEQIREQGGSEIYMMLTNAKIRALKAWIQDIIMQPGDKPWEAKPTPIPEVPPFIQRMIAERVMQTMFEGETQADIMERVGKLRDLALVGIREDAKKRAERMSQKIDDQLVEGKWDTAMKEFIDDFATFPGAILKAPVKHKRKKLAWAHDSENNVIPITEEEIRKEIKRVSPFDAYPSPESETPQDGDFIEHVRFTRRELRSMIGVEGYSKKSIEACLEEYGAGGLREWLWEDSERRHLEGKEYTWARSTAGTMDGLHYWGSVQGRLLIEWGARHGVRFNGENIKPLEEYEIDAIKIGRHIIRAVINKDPLARRPYHKACFDPIPGSFWGNSMRYLMRDIQSMCNAQARAIANNVGMASGPMAEVNIDRLVDEEGIDMYPWRVFQTTRGELTGNAPSVHFFQPNLHAHELLRIYEEFERRADDVTGIPRYVTGNERVQGAGRTSSGLSMLMNSASRGVKAAIGEIDLYVVRGVVEQYYFLNMVEDPDPMIKGDVKVQARGATALLVKEQAHNDRLEFLQMTANEMDMQIIGIDGRAKMLREHAKVLDMPGLIPDDDEFKARLKEQAEQQPKMSPYEAAKLELEKARLDQDGAHRQTELDIERKKAENEVEISENRLHTESVLKDRENLSRERIEREKMRHEERLKRFLAEMERKDRERDERINREQSERAREGDIQAIMKVIGDIQKSLAEFKPATATQTQAPISPPKTGDIHLHIDNKTGSVTKRIKVDRRDAGGKVEEMTSTTEE